MQLNCDEENSHHRSIRVLWHFPGLLLPASDANALVLVMRTLRSLLLCHMLLVHKILCPYAHIIYYLLPIDRSHPAISHHTPLCISLRPCPSNALAIPFKALTSSRTPNIEISISSLRRRPTCSEEKKITSQAETGEVPSVVLI